MFRIRPGKPYTLHFCWVAALGMLTLLLAGCQHLDIEQPAPRRDTAVKQSPSYSQDIQPIFTEYCVKCHNPRDAHKGLRLDTYQAMMRGHKDGPVIVPGRPEDSILLRNVKRETAASSGMPFHQEPLARNQVQNIENWVRQGALDN
ncbi:MAG: hypothetical protein HY671_09795 [Chloroflexi bacterium]|nr:hypothetical protein [Chloroflexota bacterium]